MTEDEIKNHKIVAAKLWLINKRSFDFIGKNLGRISEYDVHRFIISEYKKQSLVTDKKVSVQIIGVNENAAIPHYFPSKNKSKIIKKNSLILIDTWARLQKKDSPFADITWMVYSGKIVPKEIQETFNKVIGARDSALRFIRQSLKRKRFPKTKSVDGAVRDYFKKFSLKKYFIHGTGHSLGIKECHGKYFRFGKKSESQLKPNIPFTIEPGLYFKDEFGIRSEINCYVNEDFKLIITTKVQRKIIKI